MECSSSVRPVLGLRYPYRPPDNIGRAGGGMIKPRWGTGSPNAQSDTVTRREADIDRAMSVAAGLLVMILTG